jgi:hypothetical protein
MRNRTPPTAEGRIIASGLAQGGFWGARLGALFVAAIFVNIAADSGRTWFVPILLIPIAIGFALVPGAIVGLVVGTAVAVALVLSGEGVRRHHTRTRIVAAGVCAIPAVLVFNVGWWSADSLASWLLMIGVAVAVVVAGVLLAPTVGSGRLPESRART